MSLRDSKTEVMTTIGSYVSLLEREGNVDNSSVFSSINNKDDIVPFMLDTLKTVAGTDAVKEMVGELFTTFVDTVEPQLKDVLKKQLVQFNAGDNTPAFFQSGGTGVSVDMKSIDLFGKLKSAPDSAVGGLLYGETFDFDRRAYEAILNDGTISKYNNLDMIYNAATDKITFTSNTSGNIGDWLATYVDDAVIINKTNFMTNVMDSIYGSVSSNMNKTEEELFNELQIKNLIQQMINNDAIVITQDDLDELLQKARDLRDGVVYDDMGCGILASSLPLEGMHDLIQSISGATDTYYVADQVDRSIDASTSNPEVTDENKETIKDGFFQKIIRIITEMLAQIMTSSPQIKAIMAIVSAFQNQLYDGTTLIENAIDDMSNFRVFLKCIIDEAMGIINKFIFDKVISYLYDLTKPVIQKIVQEKINQYIGVLKSLVPVNI